MKSPHCERRIASAAVHDTGGFGHRILKLRASKAPSHSPVGYYISRGATHLSSATSSRPIHMSQQGSSKMETMMKCIVLLALFVQASLLSMLAVAADAYFALHPEWLQDYCVADRFSNVTVNGLVKCKNSAHVKVADFLFRGFDKPGDTNNPTKSAVTPVLVSQLPGLNGLGVAIARLDFAKGGVSVPHLHPRASEILAVLEGELYVGFVNSTNHLFATTLYVGDVFVFPKALVHFQVNVGSGPAMGITAFSSQNPGVVRVGPALFASKPPIQDVVLEKGFKINQKSVHHIRNNFNA